MVKSNHRRKMYSHPKFPQKYLIDALITDIKTDVEVARRSLARKNYVEAKEHTLFV